jgi:hypothetical protein
MDQDISNSEQCRINDEHSSIVDRQTRTTAKHGLSREEIDRLSGCMAFMQKALTRRTRLSWLTVNKGANRELISDVQKRITRLQKEHGLPAYNVTVLETSNGLHAHIPFVSDRAGAITDAIKRSEKFGDIIHVGPIDDAQGLARRYLAKERTPQAGYRRQHMLGGRLKGSHRLDGGGDRVRPSLDLKRDAIEARYIKPWQKTNARRAKVRKKYRPRQLKLRALRPVGQLALLPEIERPVTRLRQFGRGHLPKAVAIEAEFRRQQLGLSQDELAARIGCSQGQYANAIRGHDPLSAFVANRLRDVLGK